MTAGYRSQEEHFFFPPVEPLAEEFWPKPKRSIDALTVALVGVILFFGLQLALDAIRGRHTAELTKEISQVSEGATSDAGPEIVITPPDPALVVFPYDTYWITQGLHGMSYGHLAIDLAAGKGSPVRSPINGTVTVNTVDQYGNTTLVIENERYQVTLLHGDYSAGVGQPVAAGEQVGLESNHGYTTDMNGVSCRNRDCGYHTHLNLFDKVLGRNVNPLEVLTTLPTTVQ